MAVWSGCVMGPGLHFWYKGLERLIPGNSVKAAIAKSVVEQSTLAVALVPAFFSGLGFMAGDSWVDIEDRIRRFWWPTLLMNWQAR
jgi:protein Mpv17